MKKIYWLSILIMLNLNSTFSQDDNCSNLILDYTNFIETDSTKWNLTLIKDDTIVLLYYGAAHSKDPSHIQFDEIENAWHKSKSDIALYEGPNRGFLNTKKETVEKLGESGFLRFLASQDSVETQSLEPNPVHEAQYLSQFFSLEKIKLFYLLREANRVRESFSWDEIQITGHIESVLLKANALAILKDTILTIHDIEESFKKYWGDKLKWWQAPSGWFDPLKESETTGGIFTNDVNRYSSHYRNLHMYELITGLLRKNKRVFAVVGRNHVPMQSKAIQCEWEKIISSE